MKLFVVALLLIASPTIAQPSDMKSANEFCQTKRLPGSINLEPNIDPAWEDVCRPIINKWRLQQVQERQQKETEHEKATRSVLENLIKQK